MCSCIFADEVTPGYLLFVEVGGDYQPTEDDMSNLQSQVCLAIYLSMGQAHFSYQSSWA